MRFSFLVALVVATFVVACFNAASAKKAAKIQSVAEMMWQKTLPKLNGVNAFQKAGKVRGEANAAAAKASAVAKNWDNVITKLQAGGKLKSLDTSKKEWRTAFTQTEKAGQLKGATEAQVVKATEHAAEVVAKNPSKWRYVWKVLKITYGAAVTALIVVGLNSMF
ncbi:hypothetical protein PHYSODRAFT_520811 [Phytophthora sojae]|uniref:RxLR effector protein n=1 Tax=Phytophthora sojae (strain P6497) TaxID=1094619 RepID=G4ZZN6_PHYSP|nr:hypothetical protein PHYSODRAFT_520811 [Phytophthora sojae]EGZ10382.1 hypothetical protein PHYSODRAFT_520811 [Phytophthora sojae]|eukprot:XP_009533127.1 hypothetical protein PHYSODRAFT_520811 [Phytophthora sojae]